MPTPSSSQIPLLSRVRVNRASLRRQAGIALVIVLGMLTLIAVFVVAFLSNISTELRSAKSYASGTDARSLADSAVNIVISQIQDATASPSLAWASQPGMIRTYDNSGNAVAAYKLYSSAELRPQGAFNAVTSVSTEVPANWETASGLYTDLNKPVLSGSAKHYPILDPAAVAPLISGSIALDGTSTAIEGCYIDTANAAVSSTSNPVPMPVQWLYVLKSGSLVSATADPSTPGAVIVNGATKDDPIVGRIAFWADDETCKVNVNTSSEGTFWDRPWTKSTYDISLATSMPVQNEFQRYPGHPAMTSLSGIFPPAAGETEQNYKERIYSIIPRIVGGGSMGGSVAVKGNTSPLVPDTDRLFASVDEFLFSATNSTVTSGTLNRALNPDGTGSYFNQSDIEKTRFFLTASSRAPEVNLFNKPRITLWPLQANTASVSDPANAAERNAKDKLIAFCSTVGKTPYYFQRYNTYTSASQSPIPSSQSATMDWYLDASSTAAANRNQALYAYLQSLTAANIPGLGGSLLAKYPDTRDQILTEMFDYVRSTVNTFSTGTSGGGSLRYYYTPFSPTGFITGQSQVVPLQPPNGTKGFGRFPTVLEAAVVFYRQDALKCAAPGDPLQALSGSAVISGSTVIYNDYDAPINVGAVVILKPFNPTPGPPPWTANVRYVIKGLDSFMADGKQMGFGGKLVNSVCSIDSSINATALSGLEATLQYPTRQPKTLGITTADDPDPKYYPFFTSFQLSNPTFDFSGGSITIEIYQGSSGPLDPKDLVQTIHMNFPAAPGLPVPLYPRTSSYDKTAKTTTVKESAPGNATGGDYNNYNNRLSRISSTGNLTRGRWGIAEDGAHQPLPLIICTGTFGDTVRSVEARYAGPAAGDYRLYAGLKDVPSSYFEAHGETDPSKDGKKYTDTDPNSRLVHNLSIDGFPGTDDTSSQNGYYNGAGSKNDPRGKLVKAITYNDSNRGDNKRMRQVPIVPRGLAGAFMADGVTPGDWDTGVGGQVDGPYINKADECSSNVSAASLGLYYALGGYIGGSGIVESGASFSPNRQISSAVAFGSLPAGLVPTDSEASGNMLRSKPWQTLLFCKNPIGGSRHPGFGVPLSGPPYTTPPDHAFLDFFTMPIVEPYAISEPFSTAGKVNMNYQIVPFTYLTRDTAVRAVLKSTLMMALPTDAATAYKWTANNPPDYRYTLNLDESTGTLTGFEKRFKAGDVFRSASEICDIFLVPQNLVGTTSVAIGNPTYDKMEAWWLGGGIDATDGYKLTGDNVREAPYGNIYPRLTTKSNTFTVHVKAQALKKSTNSNPARFVPGKDQVFGEFRGSFVVERFLDPNADSLVHADGKTKANELDADAMVGPYKFRVINSKRFAP